MIFAKHPTFNWKESSLWKVPLFPKVDGEMWPSPGANNCAALAKVPPISMPKTPDPSLKLLKTSVLNRAYKGEGRVFVCVDVFSKGSQRKTQEGNEWNNNWEVVVKKNGMVETCFLTYHKLYPRNVKNLGYSLRLLTQNTAKSRGKKKHQSVLTTKNHQPKTQTNPEDIQSIGPIELQLSQKRKGTSEAFKVWNH